MNDSHENKPISVFDEICHITIEAMCRMDMEELLYWKKHAVRNLDRAKLAKGQIELALSLKQQALDKSSSEDPNQPSMLD
ncbi:MAG: hypothetical protein MK052_03040 [Alphaproteobacteria bacterium]|jgi:hypothetical protein|nr:hypothetical protein [Alphaproteobacteria bacterium]